MSICKQLNIMCKVFGIRGCQEVKVSIMLCVTELKSSFRKLEHENADLRFLNNQYIHKMRSLEQDAKQKTERILQLQEKNFHAVVQTPGKIIVLYLLFIYIFI